MAPPITAPEAVMAAAMTTGGAGQSWKKEAMATAEMLAAVEERILVVGVEIGGSAEI